MTSGSLGKAAELLLEYRRGDASSLEAEAGALLEAQVMALFVQFVTKK